MPKLPPVFHKIADYISGQRNTKGVLANRDKLHLVDIQEGVDYYFDGNQRMVFTEAYHLKRGYCCGNGCLHCPYPPGGGPPVSEPPADGEEPK